MRVKLIHIYNTLSTNYESLTQTIQSNLDAINESLQDHESRLTYQENLIEILTSSQIQLCNSIQTPTAAISILQFKTNILETAILNFENYRTMKYIDPN